MYKEYDASITNKQKKELQTVLQKKKKHTLSIKIRHGADVNAKLLLTKAQIMRIEKMKVKNRDVTIKMSKRQLKANISHSGGFLSLLAGLAARVLPTIFKGLASGLISGGIYKAITGNGLFIKKGKHCYRADPVQGDGLYLSRYSGNGFKGDGLFLKHGRNIVNGEGLVFGKDSPFRDIPILGWIL